jgi:UPF0755 protein
MGSKEIAYDLVKRGIIKNYWFFRLYVVFSGNHGHLQAGSYQVSPSMSMRAIVQKFAKGDVIKNTITVIEGWDTQDIARYFEDKNIYSAKDFLAAAQKDYSQDFTVLADKPKASHMEGYLFPDTYDIAPGASPEDVVLMMLANFDKKITPALRKEITRQHTSVFQIITMASIIEKEVKTLEDKKIVSGILWKRIDAGMPLQVDSTINYITGKSHASATIADTKINSPYNTYKYAGLPKGPICNPGMESIMAAIYPTESSYWYYLSTVKTGKTIFSKTLEEHNQAIGKHL